MSTIEATVLDLLDEAIKHGKHNQASHGRRTARRRAYSAAYSQARAGGASPQEARAKAKDAGLARQSERDARLERLRALNTPEARAQRDQAQRQRIARGELEAATMRITGQTPKWMVRAPGQALPGNMASEKQQSYVRSLAEQARVRNTPGQTLREVANGIIAGAPNMNAWEASVIIDTFRNEPKPLSTLLSQAQQAARTNRRYQRENLPFDKLPPKPGEALFGIPSLRELVSNRVLEDDAKGTS